MSKTRMTSKPTRVKSAPVETVAADPMAMEEALRLADGDRRRLTIDEQGRVIVHNNPVRGAQ